MITNGQKAPSAIRCIKTKPQGELFSLAGYGQKAPSAIRCIKTFHWMPHPVVEENVRKHRAP